MKWLWEGKVPGNVGVIEDMWANNVQDAYYTGDPEGHHGKTEENTEQDDDSDNQQKNCIGNVLQPSVSSNWELIHWNDILSTR